MLQAAMAPPTQKNSSVYKEAARLVAVLASLAEAPPSKVATTPTELVRIDRLLRRRTSPPPAGVTHSHSRVHSPVQQAHNNWHTHAHAHGPGHHGHREHALMHGTSMPEGESEEVDIEAVSEASK